MSCTGSLLTRIGGEGTVNIAELTAMLEFRFEIAGRKLDPCFIRDGADKTRLLSAAEFVKRMLRPTLRLPDSEDPLCVIIRGENLSNLRYELRGPRHVLDRLCSQNGIVASALIPVEP